MIDCFPFCNELDILEIRLYALAPYVDKFVLAEGDTTHSGKPKPLFFAENRERFDQFNIEYILIPSIPGSAWALEQYGREHICDAMGSGDQEEIILISDVDEIPDLSNYGGVEGVFEQELYNYFCNYKSSRLWRGTFAVKRKNLGKNYADPSIRKKIKYSLPVVGGGWHFSSVGPIEQIIYKIQAFAHTELDTPENIRKLKETKQMIVEKRYEVPGFSIEMPSGPPWLINNLDLYEHLFI